MKRVRRVKVEEIEATTALGSKCAKKVIEDMRSLQKSLEDLSREDDNLFNKMDLADLYNEVAGLMIFHRREG